MADPKPVDFALVEFNPRRVQRGAEGALVRVIYDDGTTDTLWMSKADIGRNVMAWGRCKGLSDALEAYHRGVRVEERNGQIVRPPGVPGSEGGAKG